MPFWGLVSLGESQTGLWGSGESGGGVSGKIPVTTTTTMNETTSVMSHEILPLLVLFVSLRKTVSLSVVSDSLTPWTVEQQATLSRELSRQEYWSGLPFPSPGD